MWLVFEATSLRGQDSLQAMLLKKPVYSRGDSLRLEPRGVPNGFRFNARITDGAGRNIDETVLGGSSDLWSPGSGVGDGIYRITICADGRDYSQLFAIGDLHDISALLLVRAGRLELNDRDSLNIEGLRRRISLLLLPENRTDAETERRTDQKLVYTLNELLAAVTELEKNREAFRGVPGLHIRGFHSNIDDGDQFYRVFIPAAYRGDQSKLALVIMMPTVTSASRPFIESAFMAAHVEAEHMSAVANRYGLGILWVGYRNQPAGLPCEFTHLEEAMTSLCSDYRIDLNRVYLLGTCSGGALATEVASHWPERFAAIALLDPVFHIYKTISSSERDLFSSFDGFRKWNSHTDELDAFLRIKQLPMYIENDGGEPGHGELKDSLDFLDRARDADFPVKFDRKAQTIGSHFGAWEDLLGWLSKQRRSEVSAREGGNSGLRTQGSSLMTNVFAHRFVVVLGTGGDDADRAAITRIGKEFGEAWRESYYGPCRIVMDRDYRPNFGDEENLVLVGNNRTNAIWHKLDDRLELVMKSDGIYFHGRVFKGGNLAIQAVVKNSDNLNQKILLIGGNDLPTARFGTMNLSICGWFDYAVWNNMRGEVSLVDAGIWQ